MKEQDKSYQEKDENETESDLDMTIHQKYNIRKHNLIDV